MKPLLKPLTILTQEKLKNMNKKVYIDTLGCAKNDYDSQVLAASFVAEGAQIVDSPIDAEIIIVNTCGFIHDAKVESIDRIFEYSEYEDKKLIVTGCLSQRYHDELIKEMPEVDMFFGVNEYADIPKTVLNEKDKAEGYVNSESDSKDCVSNIEDNLAYRKRIIPKSSYTGVLKIAEGCYNACAFCAIPKIRGAYRSKRMEDCIHEAQDMAKTGITELILIAQDTSQYGRDLYGEIKLPELLRKLCKIDGIHWIRLMYVYDNGISDELIEVMASESKICKYIDIPIQHISDNVLKRMRRQSDGKSIRDCITRLRERIPEIHIRTTLLVGFPGEEQEDFDELIQFINEYKLDRLGAFAFSDEEGTPSYEMDGKLDEETKVERRDAVMSNQLSVSEELNLKKIGKTYEVLIDEVQDGYYLGRTSYDAPDVDCEVSFTSTKHHEAGDYVNVIINKAFEYDLEGEEVV